LQLLGFILLIFHVQGHLGSISSTQQLELEPWDFSQQAATTNLGPEAGSLLLESWKVLGLTRELGALNISLGGQVTFKNRHLGLLGGTSLGTLGDTSGQYLTINKTIPPFTSLQLVSLQHTSNFTSNFTTQWISKLNTINNFLTYLTYLQLSQQT
jgi:hypothetical protein